MTEHERIQAAGRWFLESDIQRPAGGVARYYRTDSQQNAAVSTEITGYVASVLLELHTRTAEPDYLAAAAKALSFLVHTAWNKELEVMPFELKKSGAYSYFFDTGIIARALLGGFKKTGEETLLRVARACADSMARDFAQGPVFAPVIELPSKKARAFDLTRWSLAPGCYQLKAALAWYELATMTGEKRYLDLFHQVLESALATHEGFLPESTDKQRVMDRLHAYCYFLEGLRPAADQTRCADAIRNGIARIARFVAEIGPEFLRADVLAQLLRMRLIADRLGVLPLDRGAATQELEALKSLQCFDLAPRLYGSFWFGRRSSALAPFANPVTTAFAVQTLHMWESAGKQADGDIVLI